MAGMDGIDRRILSETLGKVLRYASGSSAGTNYSEKDLPQTHGRESFRANDFYSTLGDWELQFVSTPDKVRTPITQGDEVETATRLYKKYARLATEYYKDEIEADEIHEGNIFENLGE